MSTYDKSVVTEIRRKTSNGFTEAMPIGTRQNYVGALLNSSNHNLEEQSILGVDYSAVIWSDTEDVYHMTKKFYNETSQSISSNGYYILFVTDYSASIKEKETELDEDILYVRPTTDSSFALVSDNVDLNIYDDEGHIKVDSDFVTIRQEVLCFRTDVTDTSDTQSNTDIVISTKLIDKKIEASGKIRYRQRIIDSLNN